MAAGGEEAATAFVETSLGTRLAVSFPASATTAAHLKRIVSDEHAAAFPRIGRIAVESFEVRRRGSWYHLADSVAVRAAFHGIKGAWHLQAHLAPPHSAPAPAPAAAAAREDPPECGTSAALVLHHELCSPRNTVGDPVAASQLPLLSDALSTDKQDKHDHLGLGDPSTLISATPRAAGTSLGKRSGAKCGGYAIFAENSDVHVLRSPARGQPQSGSVGGDPRGTKHFREENEGRDKSIPVICNEDQSKCKDNPTSKRICKREDGPVSGADADAVGGSSDIIVLSSDDEMLRDECGFDDTCCHDEGLDLAVLTRPGDQGEQSVELCNRELTKSTADDKEPACSENPAPCFSVNKNDSNAAAEEHADEGMAQEKLVEQQDHLDNGQDPNFEDQPICFSVNRNHSTAATKEHGDEGMAHEKLIGQQDHPDTSGAEVPQNCNSKDNHSTATTKEHGDEGMAHEKLIGQQEHLDTSGAEVPQNCNSKDASDVHSERVPDCLEYEGSSRSSDLKCCKKSECEVLTDQVGDHDRVPSEVEVAPVERAPQKRQNDLPPCVETLKESNSSQKEAMAHKSKEKEAWKSKVRNSERSSSKETNLPPCAGSMREGSSSGKEAATHEEKQSIRTVTLVDVDGTTWTMQLDDSEEKPICGQKEPPIPVVCNSASSKDLPPCVETLKEVNSSEKEATSCKVKGKEPLANKVCDGERSSKGTDYPPCARSMKEVKSPEKEEMSHKVKEEEPWTPHNVERSISSGTDHPPCADSIQEGNSSEKEGVTHEGKQSTRTVTLVDVDGTKWTIQLDDSDETVSLEASPTPSDPTGSKHVDGTSADGAGHGASNGRRRPRAAVGKVPNSRAVKMYGYR